MPLPLIFRLDDLSGEPTRRLIARHLEGMRAYSPPDAVHAMDVDALRQPGVTFWSAWVGDEIAGCGALRQLDAQRGEIKSMRVADTFLGRGIGRAILYYLIDQARARGLATLWLETGSAEAFTPALRLYERAGFQRCGPFEGYAANGFSVFMTRPVAEPPERPLRSLCVFCGANPGNDPRYAAAAREFGALVAGRGMRLIYGGGRTGLMGQLADAALGAGGEVIGIIPRNLMVREIGHGGVTELHVVETMHERKALMASMADGFVALPGGLGTLEEIFEVWTWAQLGIHTKPVGFLNVAGFYDQLLGFLDHAVNQELVRPPHRALAVSSASAEELLTEMMTARPPTVPKWLELEQA